MRRVVVWGTGNMGATAIRSTVGYPGLSLTGLITSSADKTGRDASSFAGLATETGVLAVSDPAEVDAVL